MLYSSMCLYHETILSFTEVTYLYLGYPKIQSFRLHLECTPSRTYSI